MRSADDRLDLATLVVEHEYGRLGAAGSDRRPDRRAGRRPQRHGRARLGAARAPWSPRRPSRVRQLDRQRPALPPDRAALGRVDERDPGRARRRARRRPDRGGRLRPAARPDPAGRPVPRGDGPDRADRHDAQRRPGRPPARGGDRRRRPDRRRAGAGIGHREGADQRRRVASGCWPTSPRCSARRPRSTATSRPGSTAPRSRWPAPDRSRAARRPTWRREVAFQQVTYGPGPMMQKILGLTGLPPERVPHLTINQVVDVTDRRRPGLPERPGRSPRPRASTSSSRGRSGSTRPWRCGSACR